MADIGGPSTDTPKPLGGPFTTFGLLAAPGFSSVAIPVPRGSLYLNPVLTSEPAPILYPSNTPSQKASPRSLPPPRKPEQNGAYTLLIVDDNPVDRKV
jgi:hypothetical protein